MWENNDAGSHLHPSATDPLIVGVEVIVNYSCKKIRNIYNMLAAFVSVSR